LLQIACPVNHPLQPSDIHVRARSAVPFRRSHSSSS
jgi:hypothetical protein